MLRRFIELLFYDYEERRVIIEEKFFWGLYSKKKEHIYVRKRFTLKKILIVPYILSKLNQNSYNRITPDYIRNKYFIKSKDKEEVY